MIMFLNSFLELKKFF